MRHDVSVHHGREEETRFHRAESAPIERSRKRTPGLELGCY